MSEIVAGIIWFAFAGYAFWYMFKAREYQPLTLARALMKKISVKLQNNPEY